MITKQISIIGLGWLGLPLYKHLSQLDYKCKGSTTTSNKKQQFLSENIDAYLLELKENEITGSIVESLKGSSVLILNISPGLRKKPTSNYVAKIKRIIPYIEESSITKVLFVSSTSVFEDELHFPVIENSTLPNSTSSAGIQIRKVEKLLMSNVNFETTILRFAGLVNMERHPARMMSKRPSVKNAKAPVNLIHRKDCIGIISAIIKQELWKQTLNASYPKHISKQEYYNSVCDNLNLQLPNFDVQVPSKGKLINGNATAKALNYKYKYVV